jgi:hypothetical protein
MKELPNTAVQSNRVPWRRNKPCKINKLEPATRDNLDVGVLDRQTYQGGTRGSRLCGGDRDRKTENSKVCARTQDTRFIQVRAAKVASPTSCLGIKYGALRLVLVVPGGIGDVRLGTRPSFI